MKQFIKPIKLFYLLFLLTLAGCSSVFDSVKRSSSETEQSYMVAVLLPITGKQEAVASSLLQSINLAYQNNKNPHLQIQIYDTKGDKLEAKKMANKAISDGAKVIIGPLLTDETKEVSIITEAANIPLLTLSNDISVLQDTNMVFTLAYLPSIDYEYIINYAIKEKGSKNFAILAPENKYGEVAVATIKASLKNRGIVDPIVATYPQNELKLSPYIQKLITKEDLDKHKALLKKLQNKEVILNEDGTQITGTPFANINFDTLIIADFGSRLSLVSSHLPFVDIDYKSLIILGNSNWDSDEIAKDNFIQGSYYPRYQNRGTTKLGEQYKKYYNKTPSLLDHAVYDAILLVSSLIYMDQDNNLVGEFTKEAILKFNSQVGSLGNIYIREDGITYHNMFVDRINNYRRQNVFETPINNYIVIENYKNLVVSPLK
jgi:hypothetical protein